MEILGVSNPESHTSIYGRTLLLNSPLLSSPWAPVDLNFIIHNRTSTPWINHTQSGFFYAVTTSLISSPEEVVYRQNIALASEIPPMKPLLQQISINSPSKPGDYSIQINLVAGTGINASSPNLKRWIGQLIVVESEHIIPASRARELYKRFHKLFAHSIS